MFYSLWTFRSSVGGVVLLAAATLVGCGRDEVTSYRVPRTEATNQQAHSPGDGHDHGGQARATIPAVKWKTPAGWEEVEPGQMRAASFKVKGEANAFADVSVIPLPGLAGADIDNVNRWRGQVGLEPVKADELAKISEQVEVAGEKAQLFDMAGENVAAGEKMRILAAILRKEGIAWFFKMSGPDALVAAQKDAFKGFLQGVTFTEGATMPMPSDSAMQNMQLPASHPPIGGMTNMGLPPSHPPIGGMTNSGLPPSHPPISGMGMGGAGMPGAAPSDSSAKPAWTVPSNWTEVPGGQFLAAKFMVKGEEGSEASVNVSTSAGTGGGVAGNVNRWRGQLGLEILPEDKLELAKMQTATGEATVVDLNGTDARTNKKTRLVGVVIPQGDHTWFYKLMGDETMVAREKDAFLSFVKEARSKQ